MENVKKDRIRRIKERLKNFDESPVRDVPHAPTLLGQIAGIDPPEDSAEFEAQIQAHSRATAFNATMEHLQKLAVLAEEYEIDIKDSASWMLLALAIARDFVHGFDQKPEGRPKEWSWQRLLCLAVRVNQLTREGHSRSRAFAILEAQLNETQHTRVPISDDALKKQYRAAMNDNAVSAILMVAENACDQGMQRQEVESSILEPFADHDLWR